MKHLLADQLAILPQGPGVYIFRDVHNKPLYVGKSVNIAHRVRSYFQSNAELPPKTAQMVTLIKTIDHLTTDSEVEALLLEVALIQAIRPRYNVVFKDDKQYQYIEVTDSARATKRSTRITHPENAFPTVTTTRSATKKSSLYIGPFPDSKSIKYVLKTLRKLFGWCGYASMRELELANKPCFYFHIKQCPGYCAHKMTYNEYLKHMDRVILFLHGKKSQVLNEIKKLMHLSADQKEFERASLYRDQVQRLEYITKDVRGPEFFLEDPVLYEEQFYFARQQLKQVIGPYNPSWSSWLRNLERLEAYDISNLQGTNATGSMVVFVQGHPQPGHYRRFKIVSEQKPNDVLMMAEVMSRRFSKKQETPEDQSFGTLPQLIVIDGGKSQVRSAFQAVLARDMRVPIIGLAKRLEQIIIPVLHGDTISRFETITLPRDAPALHLLQHIRDEAHRFAKNYHMVLRKKRLMKK